MSMIVSFLIAASSWDVSHFRCFKLNFILCGSKYLLLSNFYLSNILCFILKNGVVYRASHKIIVLWLFMEFSKTTYRKSQTLQYRTVKFYRNHQKSMTSVTIGSMVFPSILPVHVFLWPPYVIVQAIIFLPCGFFLLSSVFFLRLISAAADWMSTILRHMVWPQCEFRIQVWNTLRAAGWKCGT